MRATLEQIHQMMRDDDLRFFVSDNEELTILPFDHTVRSFNVHLFVGEERLLLFTNSIQGVPNGSPLATTIFRELLGVNFDTDLARVYREDDTGSVNVYLDTPLPEDTQDAEDFGHLIRTFAADVKLVINRLHAVLLSGKTTHDRTTDATIDKLFSDCYEQFALEKEAKKQNE